MEIKGYSFFYNDPNGRDKFGWDDDDDDGLEYIEEHGDGTTCPGLEKYSDDDEEEDEYEGVH